MGGRYFGGIDVGSCTTKAVVLDEQRQIRGYAVDYSGTDFEAAARSVWRKCLAQAGVQPDRVIAITSTGYGRKSVPNASDALTEISCHGKGSLYYVPGPLTVIDIGGQDNKVIKLDAYGKRTSFKMNRKCAAGTGAFLEEMALRMRIPLSELNSLAEGADGEVALGSFCTVFSATEVLEKIKAGNPVPRIVRGLFHSVVKRILEMDTLAGTVLMTGGVIEHNPFLAQLLGEHIGGAPLIPPHPQGIGALGASLYAFESQGACPPQ
jgi:predicted CoA-substrate-specific enzyme activase